MKNYPFIDGLRALAVAPVILFHFNVGWMSGGYVGVDTFFVISGFLITGLITEQLRKGGFSILYFYERRARRILPALFVTCLLATIAALAMFLPNDFIHFSTSLKGISIFSSNFTFARRIGYFTAPVHSAPLLHTWSLAVEEQFYLIFPVLLVALNKYFRERQQALTLSLALLFALSLVLNIVLIKTSPEKTFYLLHTRAWELLAGALLSVNWRKVQLNRAVAEVMGLAGAALLVFCFAFYDRNTVFPGLAAVAPVAATILLIWSNLDNVTASGRVLSVKLFTGIGLISYGLYLYHWPVIVFTRYFLDRELTGMDALIAIPCIVLMSLLSYKLIEHPVRTGFMLPSRNAVFSVSAAGLVLFFVMGGAGLYTKGFPARFNGATLQYAEGAQDINDVWNRCIPDPHDINEQNVCKLGAVKASPDFLVWGDSHAEALEPGIDAMAKQHGLSGWMVTYRGCPSLVKVERADDLVGYPCLAVSEAALQFIRVRHIKTVLLINRWDMYAIGWEPGGIGTGRQPSIAYTQPDGQVLYGRDSFMESFQETVKELTALGAHVWVVKQVPPQLAHAPSALAKAVYFGRDPEKLRRPYADVLRRRAFVDETFASVTDKSSVTFIDPMAKFCPGMSPCKIEENGRSLYRDDTHLSVYGALWSRDMLAPYFKEMR